MNIDWNPDEYSSSFSFVPRYGAQLLDLVDEGDGRLAVDLGCGTGALTDALAGKGYRVLGIDASEEMLAKARSLHPDLQFACSDAAEFELEEKAAAVFSNAMLHWIDADRHPALAANLFAQMAPGAAFVAECGGSGCAELVHSALEEAFAERGLRYRRTFYFPTVGEYTSILEEAGFRIDYATLFDRPTPQQTEDGVVDWIRMFVKEPFTGMDADLVEEILDDARRKLRSELFVDGTWYVDYVRLRVKARKPRVGRRFASLLQAG